MVELIITEKPSAAKKIAEGLSSKPQVIKEGGASYFHLIKDGKEILVVSAVGHLFTVAEKEKSFKYPSFDIEWVPSFQSDKNAAFSKKYYNLIKKVAKKADSFTVACDYDVEGEVIGLNVLKYICKQKDANRMKFSTLVKEDVIKSYDNKLKTIDWGQAKAGETRHFLDWLYGINISRAMTLSVKAAGSFKVLSSGRVQGPSLKILADKELEIKGFKPEPFWQIKLDSLKDSKTVESVHVKDKFFDKEEVDNVFSKVKDEKTSVVRKLDTKDYKQPPPVPFDLGGLQSEAYKLFKISPKNTLQIAQNLYLKGLTSYPRTSSQQLPKEIGFRKILGGLEMNPEYSELVKHLFNNSNLKPNNGKKTDPAHPAIYPTGLKGGLTGNDKKVYDLIVKRFFATFGESALRRTLTITFSIKEEDFITKGSKTIEKGWHLLYAPYVKFKEEELPLFKEGEEVKVKKLSLLAKHTEPPKRYTPASLISELEKRGLGTKATRADIIQHLYDRGYLNEKSIEVTDLGLKLIEILKKYSPEMLDEEMTRHFENEMESIREHKTTPSKVLDNAKKELSKILDKFKKHEKEIGKELLEANKETKDHLSHVGQCPKCKEGNLKIRRGKFGLFVACDKYPDCKTTFSLPANTLVKPTDKVSETGYPIVQVIRKGKRPQDISLNRVENIPEDMKDLVKKLESGEKEYKDPESGEKMVLKYGFYGPFLAFSDYPKRRKIVNLDQVN